MLFREVAAMGPLPAAARSATALVAGDPGADMLAGVVLEPVDDVVVDLFLVSF